MSHTDTAGCPAAEPHTQVEFSKDPPHEGSPETEFRQRPDVTFERKFFNRRLRFPDGLEAEVWGFEDQDSGRGLPSPPIRVREGQIVHVTVEPSKGPHTIHLHGIEPDPRNDGVGHTSFEVTGSYTYQFQGDVGVPGDPNRGMAGTYFYHCHVNTVLHVQMGMFGPLIVDPPTGRGTAFVDDPVGYDTRAETLLVPMPVDPRWHELNHAAGLDGEDVGLNRFEPSHFYLLGGDLNDLGPAEVKTVGRIPATVAPDRPGLLRINNSSYFPTIIRFHDGLEAEVYCHDGRVLRDTSQRPSPPVTVRTNVLGFGSAERYDMRLRPPAGARPGDTFSLSVEWRHWITNEVLHTEICEVVVLDPDASGEGQDADAGEDAGAGTGANAPAPQTPAAEAAPAAGAPPAPSAGAPAPAAAPAQPGSPVRKPKPGLARKRRKPVRKARKPVRKPKRPAAKSRAKRPARKPQAKRPRRKR
jgi:FtsP/CotA-like multicopper oxidase with cupredoxin domain